jgi:predicted outer membrane repeat protein
MKTIFNIICLFLVGNLSAQVYVSVTASGNGSGTSWSNASTIQNAITNAVNDSEIRIKQGVYIISSTINFNKTLRFFGGYSGSGTVRNPTLYKSILDGSSSINIIKTGLASTNTIFDGLTFRNGLANVGLDINDIKGGALSIYGDATKINNCIFSNNTSLNRIGSGAIYLWSVDNIIIENSTFTNNIANYGEDFTAGGGAIHVRFGLNTIIRNSDFTNNSSQNTGGAIHNLGFNNTTIKDCTFTNNTSQDMGGAIFTAYENVKIENCLFDTNHSAIGGGALYVNTSESTSISNSIFKNNTTDTKGGAINNNSGILKITNSLFQANSADEIGGALYNKRELYLTNSTLVSNTNTAIGHHYLASNETTSYITKVYNSIFYNNTSISPLLKDIDHIINAQDNSTKDFRKNIFQEVTSGTNNLVGVNPMFQNFSGNNFQLQTTSPGLNFGLNSLYNSVSNTTADSSLDLADNPRIFGSSIDLGAFESQQVLSTNNMEEVSIMLYPNPASDFLHIININNQANYTIADLTGKLILNGKINDKKINVSNLQKGLYFISIEYEGKIITEKIILK